MVGLIVGLISLIVLAAGVGFYLLSAGGRATRPSVSEPARPSDRTEAKPRPPGGEEAARRVEPVPQPPPAAPPPRAEPAAEQGEDAVRRGVALAGQGQFDRAILEFNRAIAAAPQLGKAYANRGVAYMHKRDYTRALADLRRAAELAPRDPLVHYNLAALYSVRHETAQALEALGQALELGFRDLGALRRDEDFERLRSDQRFHELLKRYGLQ